MGVALGNLKIHCCPSCHTIWFRKTVYTLQMKNCGRLDNTIRNCAKGHRLVTDHFPQVAVSCPYSKQQLHFLPVLAAFFSPAPFVCRIATFTEWKYWSAADGQWWACIRLFEGRIKPLTIHRLKVSLQLQTTQTLLILQTNMSEFQISQTTHKSTQLKNA